MITPRVVRNLAIGAPERGEIRGGTELTPGSPPLRVQGSGKLALAPSGARTPGAQGDAPAAEIATEVMPEPPPPAASAAAPAPAPAEVSPAAARPGIAIKPVGAR